MNKNFIEEILDCGNLLWEKDLAVAFNGNISMRAGGDSLLITGTGTSLGRLKEEDISLASFDGRVIEGASPSSELRLHADIYRAFPAVMAIVHTHTTFTNAFFLKRECFRPATFEAEYMLGEVLGVPQSAVNVVDTAPVIEALRGRKVVVLRRHGVVAPGETLFASVARIQVLEEQIKMEAISKLF